MSILEKTVVDFRFWKAADVVRRLCEIAGHEVAEIVLEEVARVNTGNQTPNGGWALPMVAPGTATLAAWAFPGGEDALILDGDAVYKVFGAALSQTITGTRTACIG